MKKGFYKKWWVWVISIFAVTFICAGMPDTIIPTALVSVANPTTIETMETAIETSKAALTPMRTATPTPKLKTAIDPDVFDKKVKEKIAEIDESDLIGKIETQVISATGFVKLYFNELSSWANMSDVERKEFINSMGTLMDSIASVSVYPGTKTIATSTTIYSPNGLELGERTVWGNTKLK